MERIRRGWQRLTGRTGYERATDNRFGTDFPQWLRKEMDEAEDPHTRIAVPTLGSLDWIEVDLAAYAADAMSAHDRDGVELAIVDVDLDRVRNMLKLAGGKTPSLVDKRHGKREIKPSYVIQGPEGKGWQLHVNIYPILDGAAWDPRTRAPVRGFLLPSHVEWSSEPGEGAMRRHLGDAKEGILANYESAPGMTLLHLLVPRLPRRGRAIIPIEKLRRVVRRR